MITLYLIIGFLIIALSIVGFLLYRAARMIIQYEDRANEAVSILEKNIEDIEEILGIPVYSDEPNIKKMVNIIKSSRNSIIYSIGALDDKNEITMTQEDVGERPLMSEEVIAPLRFFKNNK